MSEILAFVRNPVILYQKVNMFLANYIKNKIFPYSRL